MGGRHLRERTCTGLRSIGRLLRVVVIGAAVAIFGSELTLKEPAPPPLVSFQQSSAAIETQALSNRALGHSLTPLTDFAATPQDARWKEASDLLLGLSSASARRAISRLALDERESDKPEFRFPFMDWVAAENKPHVSCHISMKGMDSLHSWLGEIAASRGMSIDVAKQREMILFHEMAHCEAIAMVKSAEHTKEINIFRVAHDHFGLDADTAHQVLPWLPGAGTKLRTLVWERHADVRAVFMAAQRVFAGRPQGSTALGASVAHDPEVIASQLMEFEAYCAELVRFRFFERAGSERERRGTFQDHDTLAVLSIAVDMVRQAARSPSSLAALAATTLDPDRANEVAMQIALGSVRSEFAVLQKDLLRTEIAKGKGLSARQLLASEVQEIAALHERLREHVRWRDRSGEGRREATDGESITAAMNAEVVVLRREIDERRSRLKAEEERQAGYRKRLQGRPVPLEEALARFTPTSMHSAAVERADEVFSQHGDAHLPAAALAQVLAPHREIAPQPPFSR